MFLYWLMMRAKVSPENTMYPSQDPKNLDLTREGLSDVRPSRLLLIPAVRDLNQRLGM